MAVIKQSFLSNLLSCLFGDIYDDLLKPYARIIVAIGTCILCILIGLSTICHFTFISILINLVTGTSILFIIYIVALISVLDIKVEIETEEQNYYVSKSIKKPKDRKYKLTIVWAVVLIILSINAIYFTNKYRKHYAFECSTFLVNHNAKVYHLDCDNDCEIASETSHLEKMKGYQINKSYTLCEWCKEWAEEAEISYNIERFK
jgi:predicted secreted protein